MLECLQPLFFRGLLILHGYSDFWMPQLNWLHFTSNLLISVFYYSIFIRLVRCMRQPYTLSYAKTLMILGVFTVASGTLHLINVWELWQPDHWLTEGIEVTTSVISLFTALLLVWFLPKALGQPRLTRSVVANQTLTQDIQEPDRTDQALATNPDRTSQSNAIVSPNLITLQQNDEEQKRWSEDLHLLRSLTPIINEAPDFHAALSAVLRHICEVANWDYGEAWLPRPDNSALDCSPAWYGNTPSLEAFRQARQTLNFSPNMGLPGRVWSLQQPEWIDDVTAQSGASVVLPHVPAAGFKSAFGIPILSGEQVLAVLTFFITQSHATDKRVVEQIVAMGTRLGLMFQRKQLEEELRQERDFSQTVIEASCAFIVAIDANGKTILMNQEFLNALGYSLDEVLGTDYLSKFVPERDRKFLTKTFKKLVRSKQPTLDETYVVTKDGREILIEWRARPIFKTTGELDFFFGVGIDITERKQLEEQLRQSEARYRAVVEDQTELICRFAPDGTITFVNDAYCRYIGKSREALLGHSFLEMIPDEYRETTQRHIAMLNQQNAVATREYKILLPNGETQWQQWTDRAIFSQSSDFADTALESAQTPRIIEFQSIGRDITERRRSERETARLASLALLSPNPIVEADLKGNIRYLNPEAMRLLPGLEAVGFEHPFLRGVPFLTTALKCEGSVRREVKIGKVYYEQVLHYLPEIECLRIYAFDITERKQAESQIIRNAFYDPLTGLPNRALYMDRLRQAVRRAKQHRRSAIASQPYQFAVLFLNLNRFKVVNDSLGNQWGDRLLQDFAHRLQTCLRPTDTVARLGGDEFAILLEGIQDVGDATRVADAIEQTLNTPFFLSGSDVFMTVNIGIALNTTREISDRPSIAASGESTENLNDQAALVPLKEEAVLQPEELLRNADIAMYQARSQGKACYEVFDSAMHRQALDQLQLETDLRRAIERQEFQVYYQPIVSLFTGRITGFEALIRWQHPQRGLVSPNEFIPIAEETGLIAQIGRWTLQEACRQLSIWQREFPSIRPLTINVNLSCKQFTQPDLLTQIDQILQETGLAVGSLKLEITESVVMDNPDAVKGILLQLSERKIKLCIDDFGTGYSSLSRLHHFPISTLKIDRSFVSRIGALGENSEIVQAIVTLAQTLSMDVVAEGIELSEQVSPLIALQCEYGQGYFFSKPVDSERASELLRKESRKLETKN